MNLIVCVDRSFGMSFNSRRLSRDEKVIRKIAEISEGAILFMSEYSAPLFEGIREVICDSEFCSKAQSGDFCFVERDEFPGEKVEAVFLFSWNRDYPADFYFDKEILSPLKKVKKEEFAGSSHKKITLEIYQKV